MAERREYDDANAGRASAINRDGMCEWALHPEISDMKESYSSAFLITDDVPGVGFSIQFKAGNKSSDVKSYRCIIMSILEEYGNYSQNNT